MNKNLDLKQSVHDLVTACPELADLLAGLGFSEIKNKALLETAGRMMTLPKGAALRKIDLDHVIQVLQENGFKIINRPEESNRLQENEKHLHTETEEENPRIALLKNYLSRLKSGEDLAKIQAEFVKNFQDVDAGEIMQAEQELIAQGTPVSQVQQLCDVHSALFHGATQEEKMAQMYQAEKDMIERQKTNAVENRQAKAARLEEISGHPLRQLALENKALAKIIADYEQTGDVKQLEQLRSLSTHYAKKGDLLYPQLKVKYGISGPSDVMWGVDDEIRDELGTLIATPEASRDESWKQRVAAVLQRAKEMIYKEQNILFPIAALNFEEADWKQIYLDSKQYPAIFQVEAERWPEAEVSQEETISVLSEGQIRMPSGTLSVEELTAMLDTLPLEITFVDANDINRYFNDGKEMKVFKRPLAALGRKVFTCHPPKAEPMVRQIITEFRSNTRDEVAIWTEKGGKPMYVRYMAVRSKTGKFLGTLEIVQDMEFAKKHFEG